MKDQPSVAVRPRLILDAGTAADLMAPNPVSLAAGATVQEAAVFLADKGFSAAPVIDEAGRPVGVLSQSDIVVHDREKAAHVPVHDDNRTEVHELMTPGVFSVTLETPAHKVVEEILALKVHRLFVVDGDGVLVGVISAIDVLRHLSPEQ
jgi:CBS domain-containing protein